MKTPVKCKNCGIKWLRVICMEGEAELIVNLQPNCPNCGSNYFDELASPPHRKERE